MFKFALALVAALFVSTTAYAEGISSKGKSKVAAAAQPAPAPADPVTSLFSGMPAGVYVGVGGAQALLVDFDLGNVNSDGFLGNFHAGYDFRFGKEGKLGAGVGVAHWFGETDNGVLQMRPNLELFARLNYYLPSNAMLFAGGQYKKAEMTTAGKTSDVDGWGPRVGVEFPILSQTTVTLQYAPTRYDTTDQLGEKTWDHVVGVNFGFRF